MLLLPEGQRREVSEASKEQLSFVNLGALDRKVLSLFCAQVLIFFPLLRTQIFTSHHIAFVTS